MLILAPAEEVRAETYIDLQLAVWAHLSARPVTVVIRGEDGPIDTELARRVVDDTGALSVAWLEDERRTFRYLTPGLAAEPRTRAIPGDEEPWVSRCEVMATVLHADVEQRLVELDAAPPPRAEPPPPAEEEPRPPVLFVAAAGYAPVLMAAPRGPFLQGVSLQAGAQRGRRLPFQPGFRAGLDWTESRALGAPGSEAYLARVAFRVEATGVFPVGIVDLGGHLGAVLELTEVRGLEYPVEDTRAEGPRFWPGASAAFLVRVRVTPWLAPYLLLGADVFFKATEWRLEDPALLLLRRDPVVPRGTVGLTLLLGPRG